MKRSACQKEFNIATFDDCVRSGRIDPDGVELFRRSDAMGRSVRTKRRFRKGEIVCSYGGKGYENDGEFDLQCDSDYKYSATKKLIIDGHPDYPESAGHLGAYINDAMGPIRSADAKTNVYFSNGSIKDADGNTLKTVWIRAEHDIPAGAELWLRYGNGYWRSRGFTGKAKKKK